MITKFIKKIGLFTIFTITTLNIFSYSFAQSDEIEGYTIVPELTDEQITAGSEAIATIASSGGHVWENYNDQAGKLDVETQLATGIMDWNTIINYLVFVVKFLSQAGIAVGAVFIIYAGYKYMLSMFDGGNTGYKQLKNAIIGVVIVTFSYAIMKTLTAIFLGS